MKSNFIINELWQLAIAGAFQRAGIYKSGADELEKKIFKSELKVALEGLIQAQYFNEITESKHLENITALSDHTKKYASLLKNGQLNIGVSQKVLNLFLKYLWCLKLVPTPPHFPVDRIIQQVLHKEAKELNISRPPILAWTQIKTLESYLEVIALAKQVRNQQAEYQILSLAEMELTLYSRR